MYAYAYYPLSALTYYIYNVDFISQNMLSYCAYRDGYSLAVSAVATNTQVPISSSDKVKILF